MNEIVQQLVRDCRSYRQAVDQIFTPDSLETHGFRSCLLAIQVGIAHLQLDRLAVRQEAADFETLCEKAVPKTSLTHDVRRDRDLRERLKDRLESR